MLEIGCVEKDPNFGGAWLGRERECTLETGKFQTYRRQEQLLHMTWIRTIPATEADEKLRKAIADQRLVYPKEYADPVHPDDSGGSSIVGSHTLIPDALYHAFSTFGVLMSPDLPLNRRQHEMITTVVSVTNRCKY
jgi:hypothetical protein